MTWDTFSLSQGNYFSFSPDCVAGLYMKEFSSILQATSLSAGDGDYRLFSWQNLNQFFE